MLKRKSAEEVCAVTSFPAKPASLSDLPCLSLTFQPPSFKVFFKHQVLGPRSKKGKKYFLLIGLENVGFCRAIRCVSIGQRQITEVREAGTQ